MIKKLRLKFIAVTMGTLVVIFSIMFLTINIFMQKSSEQQTNILLELAVGMDGLPASPNGEYRQRNDPKHKPPQSGANSEMARSGRFFYIKIDADGNYFEINHEMMFDFTAEEVAAYADSVLNKGNLKGSLGNLQYIVADKSYGRLIVFAERSIETMILSQLMYISIWVAVGAFVVLAALSYLLSGWAVKPVKEAFERQQQFISDAGHELKTPITIINANADVLENQLGSNMRLSHIKAQAECMSTLVRSLLDLAQSDEHGAKAILNRFDFSSTVLNTVLEFESLAYEEGKVYDYTIDEDIFYVGDEGKIKQLISILIDNAIKHSSPGGSVRICLKKAGNKPVLSVYNTGYGIEESKKEKIFDRFYRSDASRSRETGGYGLGLSIAKAIADAHKCKITVSGQTGQWVEFILTF